MEPLTIALGAGAAFAAWKLSAKNKTAKGTPVSPYSGVPVSPTPVPINPQQAIAEALASGDPKKMNAVANTLDSAGYFELAWQLRNYAATVKK